MKKPKEIPSRRRNPKARVGYVDFPTKDSTGEGGNFVRLVVIDTPGDLEHMKRFVPCCGGYVSFHLDECFIGDDLRDFQREALGPVPVVDWTKKSSADKYMRYMKKVDKLCQETESRYFPRIQDDDWKDHKDRYISRDFLAVFMIGATGWSGSWRATFNDLTREGKAFYKSVQKLYPGCELRLLSFLDT